MNVAARFAIALPVLAGLAVAGAEALELSRADALIREASTEMRTWEVSGAVPALGTWNAAREKLRAAEEIVAGDPTNHELQGLLGSLRRDSEVAAAEGQAHIVKALMLRPISPYAWASLAQSKYLRGEPGRALELEFERAAQLGPAEPGIQRMLADYGLAVWDEVSPATQAIVDRMVGAGFKRNPLEMLQISERRGRLATVCRHLVGAARTIDPRWVQLCQGWEKTS